MKTYVKIEHLKEKEIRNSGLLMPKNTDNFFPGVPITIQEKIDGSNASIQFNFNKGTYLICSHHKVLKGDNGLNGFKEYAIPIAEKIIKDVTEYNKHVYKPDKLENIAIFGEWTGQRNRLVYDEDKKGKWYVFDVFFLDEKSNYATQSLVKKICNQYELDYIEPYYEGKFKDWEHCRSFMNKPQYGEKQEGVVVKIQTDKLANPKQPEYIKLVNDDYKEVKREKLPKNITPEVEMANKLADSVVTEARVLKKLNDLIADGELPQELTIKDMGKIVKCLPRSVHEDIKEEEPEIYEKMGKLAGKLINSKTIMVVKQALLR